MRMRFVASLALMTALCHGASAAEAERSAEAVPYRQEADAAARLVEADAKALPAPTALVAPVAPQPERCCNIPNDPVAY